MHQAIVSLMEELEAADWYRQRADDCDDAKLKEILLHNMREEIEHASMLIEWLRRNNEHFARGPTFESIFGSTDAVDKFNVANHTYKEPQTYESMLDPSLADTISGRFAGLEVAMAPFVTADGWRTYDQLTSTDLRSLSRAVNDLAEPLSQVAARVVVAGGSD